MDKRHALMVGPLQSSGVSDTTAPTAPTGLTATPSSTSQIDLAWTDASADEAGFRVYRSTDGVSYSQIGTDLASGTQAYNDTTVTAGQKYYYKVGVFDAANNEAQTTAVTANTLTLSLVAYWKLDESSAGSAPVTRNDSVGTSHLADNGTTASAAGKIGLAPLFVTADQTYLQVNDSDTLSAGDIDFTVCLWAKLTVNTAYCDLINKYNNYGTGNREWSISFNRDGSVPANNRFVIVVSANGSATTTLLASSGGLPDVGTWYFIAAWHNKTTDKIYISVNNGTVDEVAHAGGIFAGNSPVTLGALPAASRYGACNMDEVGIWKRLLTADERTALYNGGGGNTHPFDSAVDNLIVFDGNSMTDDATSSYPSGTIAALAGLWDTYNFGVSGQTTIEMLADAETQIDPLYNATLGKNIVVCWEGTNDIKLGATKEDAYARLVQYCQARQAAGYQVVICTIVDRQQVGQPADFATSRAYVNTQIGSNWQTFADALADLWADTRLQDATDTTYFNVDKVHLTAAGYAIVAEIVVTAIESL